MSKQKYDPQIAAIFRLHGFDGTSMSSISKATGLQKGSLYHHYPNGKQDMAIAAIQSIQEEYKTTTKDAFHPKKPLADQLKDWAESIRKFYNEGNTNCILGAMTMSGGKTECESLIKHSFENWIESLATILASYGIEQNLAYERSVEAIERIQGALIVSRALNDTSNFQRLIQQLPEILMKDSGERNG